MHSIIARMTVWNIEAYFREEEEQIYENVVLHPVYSSDPESPNYSFSQATPSGQIQMNISNPEAFGFFKLHEEYDIVFKETKK